MTNTPSAKPTHLVFVHGAWVGPWEFAPVVGLFEQRGWQVSTVDLPSTGSTSSLAADAAAVTAALDAADGPVTLIGHSYGGVPITEAGDHPNVERLVYVAAFALDVGESLQSSLGGGLPDFWHVEDDMVFLGPNADARVEMVMGDLPPGTPRLVAEDIAAMFRPHSLAAFQAELTHAAWRSRPSTYVLTEKDVLVPPQFQQQLAERLAGQICPIPYGHAPFQEDPVEFVDLIESIAVPAAK